MKRNASTIMSAAALFFSLGGGALAASHYLITSTRQISPKVLRQLEGKRGPQGPRGLQGPRGRTGATGPTGPGGTSPGGSPNVRGEDVHLCAAGSGCSTATSNVTCPSGTVTSGGYQGTPDDANGGTSLSVSQNGANADRTSWTTTITNEGSNGYTFHVYATCQ